MSTVTSPQHYQIGVSNHARERWTERSDRPNQSLRDAWREAVPVEYPGLNAPARYARYHETTDLVLLVAVDHTLITCIPLDGRPAWEQDHVRNQVSSS